MKRAEKWIRAFTKLFSSLLRSPWSEFRHKELHLRFNIVLPPKTNEASKQERKRTVCSFLASFNDLNEHNKLHKRKKYHFPAFFRKIKSVNKLTWGEVKHLAYYLAVSQIFLSFEFSRNEKQFITVKCKFVSIFHSAECGIVRRERHGNDG